MKIKRRKTRTIKIGDVSIGGDNPIAIQSMTKTQTADIQRTINQIRQLKELGCDIVRLAVKDLRDAHALKKIKPCAGLPLVADIHFDWRLALAAIDSGVDKIRLNPGNIYKKVQIREIAKAAKLACIPIRVGLNSGSLREVKSKKSKGKNIPEIMVKEALDYIKTLEGCGFYDIVVSLKCSNLFDTIEAYQKMSRLCDYPFHLGVTASGAISSGAVKSGIAIGALLLDGIGDTIRVSLTASPREEVKLARSILEALNLRNFGPEIISCPTCGRCEVDLVKIVRELENKLNTQLDSLPVKIAVMGCVVNGPGEAKEADIGVAFGKKEGLLFKSGNAVRKIPFKDCADILLKEIKK